MKNARRRGLSLLLALVMLLSVGVVPSVAAGGAVVTDSVDFDVLLNADASYGVDPNVLSSYIGHYLDQLIGDTDKTYRISTTSAQIDPTDLTKWHLYDHYDPAWYTNGTAWAANYANDRGVDTLPSNWYYYSLSDNYSTGNASTFYDGTATNGKLTLEQLFSDKVTNTSANFIKDFQPNDYKYYITNQTAKLREHVYAYKDANGNPAMQFYGYGVPNYADFLYYPASATSTKTVKFDVDASNVWTHSLKYAGFLINAGVENGKISGYLLLLSYGPSNSKTTAATSLMGTYFYKLDNVDVDTLHLYGLRGKTGTNASDLITGATKLGVTPITQDASSFWKKSHLELEITPESVKATMQKLDDAGEITGTPITIVDESNLTDFGYGGFGPYMDYAVTWSHTCSFTAGFLFTNLQMAFAEKLSGDSLLEAYQYTDYLEDSESRYFINLTNKDDPYNYTDTATDLDLAYLNSIRGDNTVLLTDETAAADGSATPAYPKNYLGSNSKDVTNPEDLTGCGDAIAGLTHPEGLTDEGLQELAAKLAWLIYSSEYTDGQGSDATPEKAVVANLKLYDKPLGTEGRVQVNQIKRELVTGDGLKVYLDPSQSINNGTFPAKYTISYPNGTSETLTLAYDADDTDEEFPYFVVDNSSDWPTGKYQITLLYDTSSSPDVSSAPSVTTLYVLSDAVAPTPSADVSEAASDSTVDITFTNTASTADNSYTSDLVSYAVIVNTSSSKPTAPASDARTAVDENTAGGIEYDVSGLELGTYYVHTFLWDAAGNTGYAVSESFTITKLRQTLSGTDEYEFELGIDDGAALDWESSIDAEVSYAITAGDSVSLSDGEISVEKLGETTITVSAGETDTHFAAEETITVTVVKPLTAALEKTDADEGVTVTPSYTEGLYGIDDDESALEYRVIGADDWTAVTGWDWDEGYTFDFEDLLPGTAYEVRVSATDERPSTPHTTTATVEFTTPQVDQVLEGPTEYILEIGIDDEVTLELVNVNDDGADIVYTIKTGNSVSLEDDVVSPERYGVTVITATAEETDAYLEATQDIVIKVVDPLSVNLAVTGYDSGDGVKVNPTYSVGGYGIDDSKSVLEYRKVGTNNWVELDSWDWEDDCTIPFAELEQGAEYEVRVSATDKREGSPRTATDSITFRVPTGGADNGVGQGNGSAEIIVKDPEGGNLTTDNYIITVKDGDNVVAVIVHEVEDGDTLQFTETIPNLPDGNYTIEILTPKGQTISEAVVVEDGAQVGGELELKVDNGNYLKNTAVSVMPDTPKITVGGLTGIYEYFHDKPAESPEMGITNEEYSAIIADGSKTLVELIAEGVDENDPKMATDVTKLKDAARNRIIDFLLDLTLWKTIKVDGALPESPKQLTESGYLLTITVTPPEVNRRSYKIYRVHGDEDAEEIPQGESNANSAGEYFEYSGSNIILHVKMFSLYSFTYFEKKESDHETSSSSTANKGDESKVEANTSNGGSITDKGSSNLGKDDEKTYDITPDDGYRILDVFVNGESQGDVSSVTVKGSDGDTKIDVIFVPEGNFIIDAKPEEGGTISNPGRSAFEPGSESTYQFIPDEGYYLRDVIVNGVSMGGEEFLTLVITEDMVIIPQFARIISLNVRDHFAYIIGNSEGLVCPHDSITREEVAAIFFRLMTDESRELFLTETNSFADVGSGRWSNTEISTLANAGIMNGRGASSFEPAGKITRAEFAAIVTRFAALRYGDKSFTDVAGHWAENEIKSAANSGWILGYDDGSFKPDNQITRSEAMTMINRVLGRLPETVDDLHSDMIVWPDNSDTSAWFYLAVQEATNSHNYSPKADGVHGCWTGLRETRDWTA